MNAGKVLWTLAVLFLAVAVLAGCGACPRGGCGKAAGAGGGGACPACLAAGTACAACAAGAPAVRKLTTEELAALLEAEPGTVVLDARTGRNDDGRRLPGARVLAPTASAEEAAAAIPSRETKVVTYCAGLACPASRLLAARLRELGYRDVLEYPEGIAGWTAAGKPVTGP